MTDKGHFKSREDGVDPEPLVQEDLATVVVRCLLDAMIIMDAEGRVREFNKRAEEMFGYRREEVIGQELASLIIPDEMKEAHRRGLGHFNKTGEGPVIGQRITIDGLHRSGRRVPLELAVTSQMFGSERIFVAILRDLTEQMARQAELDRVRSYLDDVAINGPTVFFVIRQEDDGETKLRWISPNIKQILGFEAGDIESEKIQWRDCVHPEDLEPTIRAIEQIWTDGKGDFEYRIIDSNQEIRWIREARRVVYANDGTVEIIGSLEDLTLAHRGHQREQLLRRELDHRVKNNLQIILGECGKVMRSDHIERNQIEVLSSRIASMALVHQVLAARSWGPIDLSDLIRHVAGAMADASSDVDVELSGEPLMVGVDAAMTLATVLNELGTNAAKYGGLSTCGQGIAIGWRVEGMETTPMVHLEWIERVDGQGIRNTGEMGFGMQLIEGMIPYELGGEVEIDFEPSGLQFITRIPLDRFQADLGEARMNLSDE
ncbi:MAG: hypothetical protein CMJ39_01810 [Phycisphaerae bacterium]|nr:hypothetical protein [Phycisphaerae bacterium]